MAEKSINISIDDSRVKSVAEVLGNKSCLKILDLLAEKNASVSDIAKDLGIPLNTADYNVKKLVKAGLIEKESYWWSVKGKKIPVYKVSNKKIVISPRKISKNFIAGILTAGLMGVGALVLRTMTKVNDLDLLEQKGALMAASDRVVEQSVASGGALGANEVVSTGVNAISVVSGLAAWQWFLIGAWGGVVLFFVVSMIINKTKGESKIHHEN